MPRESTISFRAYSADTRKGKVGRCDMDHITDESDRLVLASDGEKCAARGVPGMNRRRDTRQHLITIAERLHFPQCPVETDCLSCFIELFLRIPGLKGVCRIEKKNEIRFTHMHHSVSEYRLSTLYESSCVVGMDVRDQNVGHVRSFHSNLAKAI